jgi:acyl-CoA reductase-like NAD-dependent aldehyde dehydrogenase
MEKMKIVSLVDGQWAVPAGDAVPVVNPYTGEIIAEKWAAAPEEVEKALASAFAAKKEIAAIPAYERANILKKAAMMLEQEKERFAKIISMELGKPLKNTLDEVSRSISTLELSAEEAKRLVGETLPGDASPRGTKAIAATFRVPVGVVAAVTPFNAPLNLVCHKVGPAFAAGNSIILKPASQTPVIASEFVKLLLAAGFPAKGINMVYGNRKVVEQIVRDSRVNVISFTGGVEAGRNICAMAGMKKVILELGGNAATIVHEDADIARAAQLCARHGFSNSGQTCISVQRIYVHHSILEPFTERLKQEVAQLKLGDPLHPETDVGCLVDEANAVRIVDWVNEAVQSGAELVCGGKRNGCQVEPTVLLKPQKQNKVVCEEVFGPVVSIIPYETIEQAIAESNDSSFGLQAGLFTNRMDIAYKVAHELEVGGVVINGTSNFRLDHWPYGGIKDSGVGREGPRFAVEDFTEMKMIVFQFPE